MTEEQREDDSLRDLLENIEEGETPFGIITQKGYRELQDQIHTWIRRGLIAFAIVGIACGASIGGMSVLLTKQGNTTNEIQMQRFKSFLDICLDQNTRHNNVISRIDAAISVIPPPKQAAAKEKAKPFKLILEAAVPYTDDCVQASEDRVKGEP